LPSTHPGWFQISPTHLFLNKTRSLFPLNHFYIYLPGIIPGEDSSKTKIKLLVYKMDDDSALIAILTSNGKVERDGSLGNIFDTSDNVSYSLPHTNLLSFWFHYTANVKNGNYPSYVEPLKETFPLFLDFEIIFGGGASRRSNFLNDEFRRKVVEIVQNSYDNVFQTDSRKQLIAVFSGSNPVESDDGLSHHHFQVRFPFSRISKEDYRNYFLPELYKELNLSVTLSLCEEPPVHREWPKFIRKNDLIQLPMVGYRYPREATALNFNRLSVWPDPDENPVMLETDSFGDFFLFDDCLLVRKREVSREDFELFSDDILDWLPMFLSTYFGGGLLHVRPEVISKASYSSNIATGGSSAEAASSSSPESIFPNDNKILKSLETAKYFVSLVDKSKLREPRVWLDVGRAYRNIGGLALGKDAWYELSDSINIPSEECDKYWDSLGIDNYIGIRTLAYYARSSNRLAYNEWREKWIAKVINEVFGWSKPNHSNVARLFYRTYWTDFITEELGGRKGYTWYHFNGTRWITEGSTAELKLILSSSETRRHLDEFRAKFLAKKAVLQNESEKASCDMIEQSIAGLIPKLGDDTFTNHVINYMGHYFLVPGVSNIFDQNVNLLGMENSVLEVIGEKVINRPGKPDDYIRMNTHIEYAGVSESSGAMKSLKLWLRQTFVDDELRDHYLKFCASLIRGGNPDKMFGNMTGKGNNSKSQWAAILERAFGDYCYKVSMSTFTQKRGHGSSASPDIAEMKDKRLVIAEEPEEDDTMRAGLIKQATGGDTIYGRALYQGGIKFKATFKVVTFTNNPPAFTCTDRAMKERVHFFPFLSFFSYTAPDDVDEQFRTKTFKRDRNFSDKVPGMTKAFLHLLATEYWGRYVREGLKDPPVSVEATRKYWEINDIYTRFLCDRVEIVHDDRFKLSFSDLYFAFKPWLNDYSAGRKPPSFDFFSSEIADRFLDYHIQPRDGIFSGVGFKSTASLTETAGWPN
jgi:phage/plasmid-associated DNA primase